MAEPLVATDAAAPALGLWRWRLLLVGASLLWSTSGLFARSLVFADWPAEVRGPQLALYRAIFAGLFLLILVRRPQFSWWQLPLGGVFAALNLSFMVGMTYTTVGNAIWLQATAPLWVFLLNGSLLGLWPARKERPTLVCGLLGVGLILSCEMIVGGPGEQWGVWLSLASGVCFAATMMLMRHLRQLDGGWVIAVNFLLAAALMSPYCLQFAVTPTPAQLAVLAIFGIVQMGLPYLLFQWGLRHVGSQEATCLALLEPVTAPLWVFLVYGEPVAWWTFAGASLILGGLVWQAARPNA